MCAGAIYWAGIGRLVYGLSEHRLRQLTGNHPENPTLDLPCRDVFAQRSAARPKSSVRCSRTRPPRCTRASGANRASLTKKNGAAGSHRGAIRRSPGGVVQVTQNFTVMPE